MLRRIIQPFYTTYAILIFCTCFTVALIVMRLSTFGMKKSLAARKRINTIARQCFNTYLWLTGMPVSVVGRESYKKCIYVANHTSYLDTITIFSAIEGHFHTLGKAEVSRVPIYNYFYNRAAILIDRENASSRIASVLAMRRALAEHCDLLIFPEGTFNETGAPLKEFYDGAFWLAITTGTPIVPIVFPDARERWDSKAWWKLWPGRDRAVFLDPVPVSGLTLADVRTLKDTVYSKMEKALLDHREVLKTEQKKAASM